MKISWLENMAKEGSISEAAKNEIYRDRQTLIKMASESSDPTKVDPRVAKIVQMTMPFLTNAVFGMASNIAHNSSSANQILSSRRKILSEIDPKYVDKASARFEELVEIAPSVAENAGLSARIIQKTMKSGFSNDDVANLGLMQASLGPGAKIQGKRRDIYRTRLDKQASEQSAKRAGELYADTFLLAKHAARNSKNARTIWDALKTTALVSSVPILAGIGTGLVQQRALTKSKEQMRETLDNSFEKAMRMSDSDELIREDKVKARQAFESLVHFAPHVASEPHAAKSFMNRILALNAGIDVDSIKTLSEIERNLGQANKDPNFLQSFRSGAEATGLQRVVSGGVTEALKPVQKELGQMLVGTV